MLLGLVGIYGVIAYSVSQRRREIGIRLALGAEPANLKRVFVRHGLALAAIGIAIDLPASAGLMRLLKSLLFGTARSIRRRSLPRRPCWLSPPGLRVSSPRAEPRGREGADAAALPRLCFSCLARRGDPGNVVRE